MLFAIQASNADALRLYQENLNYHIERTVSSYYLDKEDGHLLLRRGLLKLWQDAVATEPHLAGADELNFEAVTTTGRVAAEIAATRETPTSTLPESSLLSDKLMKLSGSRISQ